MAGKKKVEPVEEEVVVDNKKAKEESEKSSLKGNDAKDEVVRKNFKPNGRYNVVELSGEGRYRIIGKRGEWVSPVIDYTTANKLCSKMNLKDPEQKRANLQPKQGVWAEGEIE